MKKRRVPAVKLLFLGFFAVVVFAPLARMFQAMGQSDVIGIFTSDQFITAASHSVRAASTASLVSIAAAMILAFCVARSGIRFHSFFSVAATLPMLVPSISHGMGLVFLLGANGILTNVLSLNQSIYGFKGIVLGGVLYSFPVAFLMLLDILRYEDMSAYEAATVLGIPKWRQFCGITMPYLKRPLISVAFSTFTLIATDYGVPLIVGGSYQTLPVLMYQEVIGLLDFGKGSALGSVLLLPALAAFLLDVTNKDGANTSFVTRRINGTGKKWTRILSYLYCATVCALVCAPIFSFVLLTFVRKYPLDLTPTLHNIGKSMNMGAGTFLINSILVSILVALLGTALSYITAYLTARTKGRISRVLHLSAITSLAIPGLVLGLSYVLFFRGTTLYGTMAILVLVNIVHFFASPYLMAYNSLAKVNGNLESVGMTLGITRFRMVRDVFLPQTANTLMEMGSYFFVNSMITISAVSFLSTARNMPVALMIPQFEAQMLLECSAFVSLLILVCNLAAKGVVYFVKKRGRDGAGS